MILVCLVHPANVQIVVGELVRELPAQELLALQVQQGLQVHRVHLDHPDQEARKAEQDRQEPEDHLVLMAHEGQLVCQVHLVKMVRMVKMERTESLDPMDQRDLQVNRE